jgi:hypothetical protein
MKIMKITSPTLLTELYKLRKGDVELLINASAVPHLIVPEKKWVGYIPSLNSYFHCDDPEHRVALKKNIEKLPVKANLDNAVVKLAFDPNLKVPASSVLFGSSWVPEVDKHFDITEDTYLLASSRPDIPVFCGHRSLVERLASNFSGDIYIVNAKDLLEVTNVLG